METQNWGNFEVDPQKMSSLAGLTSDYKKGITFESATYQRSTDNIQKQ